MEALQGGESHLVDKARQGDRMAFSRLVQLHQSVVRVYLGSRIWDPAAIDDLAQETFVRAYRRLASFRNGEPFRAWLLGIARLCALEHLKRTAARSRQPPADVEAALHRRQERELEADAGMVIQREREIRALERCLERLPAHGQSLVWQHYFEGKRVTSLAEELQRKEGSLRMTLLRLRATLRACVEKSLVAGGDAA
jgi:RNA polymerase sigma-70 factor, ECF subfamily